MLLYSLFFLNINFIKYIIIAISSLLSKFYKLIRGLKKEIAKSIDK